MIKAQAIILLLMLRKEAISTHNLIPFYFAYDPKCDGEAVLISVFPIPGLCMFNSYELDQLFFGTVHSLEFQDCLILSSHTAKYSNPTTDLLSFMIGYAREEQKVFISLKIKLWHTCFPYLKILHMCFEYIFFMPYKVSELFLHITISTWLVMQVKNKP